MNKNSTDDYAAQLTGGQTLLAQTVDLCLDGLNIRLRSNSGALLDGLQTYFSHVTGPLETADIEVIAIECPAPELAVDFVDWKREPGKSGRKDSYHDVPQGRLVRKVRTGMVFLQSEQWRIAAGPCVEYDNQVINFINAQYMNWLQQNDWLICHAAALTHRGRAFGLAGFSGGGKSTLMLHALENPAFSYLTNDRLFIKAHDGKVQCRGIPKLPRVNPGTIVNNRRLQALVTEDERARLLALPRDELWDIEDKYDVMIDKVYGDERIATSAPLAGFIVLNWRRDSDQPARLQAIDINERRDLLAAIMKSPGPFYQYADGHFFDDQTTLDATPYLDALNGVPVYEVSGGIDFESMRQQLENLGG